MKGKGGERRGAFTWPYFAVWARRLGIFVVGFLVETGGRSGELFELVANSYLISRDASAKI